MDQKNSSFKNYITWHGRLNRWPYFLRYFSYLIINVILTIMLTLAEGGDSVFQDIIVLFVFFASALTFIFWIIQIIKRLHDLDKRGWYALILLFYLIPIFGWLIALIFDIYLFLAKGTDGSNRFGPDPLDGRTSQTSYKYKYGTINRYRHEETHPDRQEATIAEYTESDPETDVKEEDK